MPGLHLFALCFFSVAVSPAAPESPVLVSLSTTSFHATLISFLSLILYSYFWRFSLLLRRLHHFYFCKLSWLQLLFLKAIWASSYLSVLLFISCRCSLIETSIRIICLGKNGTWNTLHHDPCHTWWVLRIEWLHLYSRPEHKTVSSFTTHPSLCQFGSKTMKAVN